MSKIVRAVNSMISNSSQISNVIPREFADEYFFLYDNKYKWSILHIERDDVYRLFYYPGDTSINALASMDKIEWQGFTEYITYSSEDLKTKEAYETLRELYTIIKEKVFGLDKVLDDIIEKDEQSWLE